MSSILPLLSTPVPAYLLIVAGFLGAGLMWIFTSNRQTRVTPFPKLRVTHAAPESTPEPVRVYDITDQQGNRLQHSLDVTSRPGVRITKWKPGTQTSWKRVIYLDGVDIATGVGFTRQEFGAELEGSQMENVKYMKTPEGYMIVLRMIEAGVDPALDPTGQGLI